MTYWYPLSVPTIGPEEIAAAMTVLWSGETTMGEQVAEFEAAFARTVGAPHAVMVNSGSSANLLLACAFADLGYAEPDAEVLLPAVCWPTQWWSWKMAGLRPRLVDVDPTTLNATPETIGAAMSDNVGVIAATHLMGSPCDIHRIRGFAVSAWDCCEALGARYQGYPIGIYSGYGATWSLFFSHQMTTMEGGVITTGSERVYDYLRGARSHGWTRHLNPDERYTFATRGFNVRPTEVAAAIGLVQLGRLKEMNAMRAAQFATFAEGIAGERWLSLPTVVEGAEPSWFGLPLMVAEDAPLTRDELAQHFELNGVETRPILAGNIARQPFMADYDAPPLPGADAVHDRGLYIGLHPVAADMDRLISVVRSAVRVAA